MDQEEFLKFETNISEIIGLRQDSDRRAQVGVRRVQPLRHLCVNLQAHLQRTREGGLSVLPSQVSEVLQRFGLQDLPSWFGRQKCARIENQKKDPIKRHYYIPQI